LGPCLDSLGSKCSLLPLSGHSDRRQRAMRSRVPAVGAWHDGRVQPTCTMEATKTFVVH
jgi:hypothetical protein